MKMRLLANGGTQYPYEVYLNLEGRRDSTLILSEGSAHTGGAGEYPLSVLLDDQWTLHLEKCDALWLRELAQQEQSRGRAFTINELVKLVDAQLAKQY